MGVFKSVVITSQIESVALITQSFVAAKFRGPCIAWEDADESIYSRQGVFSEGMLKKSNYRHDKLFNAYCSSENRPPSLT
ncbi:hypothetical protein SBC2_77600 (plasmid) [Caballeronia sp. SBC2]|nr:hypothetical protein SBC2_77600 [Caballeronia sp. SBC2]